MGQARLAARNRIESESYRYFVETGPEICPAVFHEGSTIIISLKDSVPPMSMMVPLRNGFPFKVEGRVTPVAGLYDQSGSRAGHVLHINGFGFRVSFDRACEEGRYTVAA